MMDRRRLMGNSGLSSPRKKGRGSGTNCAMVVLLLVALTLSAAMFYISPAIAENYMIGLENDFVSGGEKNPQHDATPPPPPGAPRRTIPDLITWILSGRDKDTNTQHAAISTLSDSPSTPLEFEPGSLKLTHSQTLRHCFADPKIYGKHVQGGRYDGNSVPVSYSEKHKLAYVMLPKSGSSTARYHLKNDFQAKERQMSLQHTSFEKGGKNEGVEVISFVRDPLSRFYSQYDEAYVRTAPWQKGSNPFYTGREPHPFPYLYEGIHSYHEYEDVFCPPSTRQKRKDCLFRQSKENGTLALRFETFVQMYDGRDPFDVHLTLQTPMLSSSDGLPLHITQLFNTSDAKGGWNSIAKQFLGENATLGKEGQKDGGVIAGRSYPRRFKSDLVTTDVQRRICELTLLDYCCLNLPLPDVCKGKYFNQGGGGLERELFCILDQKGFIQPGLFPDLPEKRPIKHSAGPHDNFLLNPSVTQMRLPHQRAVPKKTQKRQLRSVTNRKRKKKNKTSTKSNAIDAAIIHIMKGHKATIVHGVLVGEVMAQLKNKVENADVEKRIESFVDAEYIGRLKGDQPKYMNLHLT